MLVQLPLYVLVKRHGDWILVLVFRVVSVAFKVQLISDMHSHVSQEPDQTSYRIRRLQVYVVVAWQIPIIFIVV